MFKFEHNEDYVSLETEGGLIEICSDIGMLCNLIYNEVREKDPLEAENFKHAIINGLADEESPCWKQKQLPGMRVSKTALEMILRRKADRDESHS